MIYPGTYSITLREDKGSKLTSQEMDSNIKYLNNLSGTGGINTVFSITASSDGWTIPDILSNALIFANIEAYTGININLPANPLPGQQMVFIKTDNNSEGELSISGTFSDGNSNLILYTQQSYTLVSDGLSWYITGQNSGI